MTIKVAGDRLLIGLSTGSLRIYRVNEEAFTQDEEGVEGTEDPRPTSQSGVKPVDLLREQEKFSKSRIEQLALVKEANTLLSLSNGYVHLHDLQSYELQETLAKTKGASAIAVISDVVEDSATSVKAIVTRLAVAVKRRLLVWTWRDGELEPDAQEMTLVTGIRSLTWATSIKLFAGLNTSYVLVNIETSVITDIVGPGSIGGAPGQDGGRFGASGVAGMGYLGLTAPKPLATKLGSSDMLLAKDINTHFVDLEGNALGRRQIPWAVAPEAVGYSYPYLIALQSAKGTMEVRNPETLTQYQKIDLPSANQVHIPQTNTSLAHAGKGFLAISDRVIWRMQAQDYDAQISRLVEQGRLDEAISLTGMLEHALLQDKDGRMREIKTQKAQILFDQKKYRDAFDLFIEVGAPPGRVISLYPPSIAGQVSGAYKNPKAEDKGSHGSEQTSSAGHHRDKSDSPSSEGVAKSPPKTPRKGTAGSESKEDGRITLGESLLVNNDSPAYLCTPLEGKDLKLATEELRGFLVSARTKTKRVLNTDGTLKSDSVEEVPASDLASLIGEKTFDPSQDQESLVKIARMVDTTLFRAYMSVSPSFAGPLFRIDNFCDPDVVNEKLIEAGRYNDLIDFFYGKKLHREALELLERFGKDKPSEAAPQLAGPQRTVAYLQNLPPDLIDLILQYSRWPLQKDPDLAMDVFLGDTENAETLDRQRVLDYLTGIDYSLAVRYLEHIIHELNDTTPSFHQRLVDVYIQGLKDNKFPDPSARTAWAERTLSFLRTSKNYQAYRILGQLTAEDPYIYEARAIVLSNMGQHKQALDIYVFKLQDPDKAEEYCNSIYLAETTSSSLATKSPALSSAQERRRRSSSITADPSAPDAQPSIYHSLLSLYLSPPPPHKPQWGPALNVLAKHGARMPASSTLDLIPEVLPIKELEAYFRGQIRSSKTVGNESKAVAGLRSTLAFREEAKLRLGKGDGKGGRNRRVVITEDRVCGVCHKRFGGSAVKVMPRYVNHPSCLRRWPWRGRVAC